EDGVPAGSEARPKAALRAFRRCRKAGKTAPDFADRQGRSPRRKQMAPQAPNPTQQNQFYPFGERPMPFNKNGKPVNPAVIPLQDVTPRPEGAKSVVVGAGIHGLSTAYHLAKKLTESGKGKGSDVVLIDKAGPGAGATGLACGCVRNLYMTKPLHAILRESVK